MTIEYFMRIHKTGGSEQMKKANTKSSVPLFTIGYENARSPAVLEELSAADVDVLVDVRAVAASRRPGFSKRQLAASLDENGIGYLHLRGLGTPTEGRAAARKGRMEELFDIYERHLGSPQAREELDELTALVRAGKRICLLCYERDANCCHRRRLAELMCERTGAAVTNLVAKLA
jgi:uncharacterized protein (DUF488 family)